MFLLKPADIWRILKDVDLEGIRESARQRVELLLVSDDGRDARALAAAMAGAPDCGDETVTHPWLRVIAAMDGLPALQQAPAAAVLVSPSVQLSPATAALRDHLSRHEVPIVAIVLGHTAKAASAPREREWSRAAVDALDADAADAIAAALLAAVPRERQVALAREFPMLRPAVSHALVDETAKANATYAFTTGVAETVPVLSAPLAIGDMVLLTKNQLLMCYRIVLAHGRDGTPQRLMGEVVGVLGGGLLFRQAARQLVGLIPVLGLVPKVAIAYAGTWAVGRVMTAWAADGRDVTAATVRRYSREGYARGRTVVRALADRARSGRHSPTAAHSPAPAARTD